MIKGKLIVIEGTDCSGKETQSNLLVEYLNANNMPTHKYCFPNYNSPTGKIIAGPYLGKEGYDSAYFSEGASNVDPKVASLYYAADRKYNIKDITDKLNQGINVVVDRYVDSNLAHQGAKILDDKQKTEMFEFLEKLEYDLLGLPKPDITIFLYMPIDCSKILKANRPEKPDQHEVDEEYLLNAEKTYLMLAKRHNYLIVNCGEYHKPKTIEQIHSAVVSKLNSYCMVADDMNNFIV